MKNQLNDLQKNGLQIDLLLLSDHRQRKRKARYQYTFTSKQARSQILKFGGAKYIFKFFVFII